MEPLLRSSLMGWVLRASSRRRRGAGPDGGGGGVGTGELRPNNRIVTGAVSWGSRGHRSSLSVITEH